MCIHSRSLKKPGPNSNNYFTLTWMDSYTFFGVEIWFPLEWLRSVEFFCSSSTPVPGKSGFSRFQPDLRIKGRRTSQRMKRQTFGFCFSRNYHCRNMRFVSTQQLNWIPILTLDVNFKWRPVDQFLAAKWNMICQVHSWLACRGVVPKVIQTRAVQEGCMLP